MKFLLSILCVTILQCVKCVPDPTCEFGVVGSPSPFYYGGNRYVGSDICCDSECGTCGGTGCGALPGGGSNCCGGPIIDSGVSCNSDSAPCLMSTPPPTPAPTPEPVVDPKCEFGIRKDNLCCDSACGTCGGVGCGAREGGGSNCCGGPILDSDLSCDDNLAPCVVGGTQCLPEEGVTVVSSTHPGANGCYNFAGYWQGTGFTRFHNSDGGGTIWPSRDGFGPGFSDPSMDTWEFVYEKNLSDFIVCATNSLPVGNPGKGGVEITTCSSGQSLPVELSFTCGCDNVPEPETDPTCEFGIIKDNICCDSECGTCGGTGCGALPGGGSNCCGGPIVANGLSCDDGLAPCIIV